jgi:hypothetical protein
MHLSRSADNVEQYKVIKIVKRAVSEVGGQMYDGLCQQLDTKEGEKDIDGQKQREEDEGHHPS